MSLISPLRIPPTDGPPPDGPGPTWTPTATTPVTRSFSAPLTSTALRVKRQRKCPTDVVAFLDAVGLERASVVGHSVGSFIARRAAETHPERIVRLALFASAVTAVNEVTLEVRASLRTLEDPIQAEFARKLQTAHLPPARGALRGIVAESCKLPARLWREVADGLLAFDDAADLGRIEAPTLIVWGEHDPLFPREQQDRLVEAIPGARLIVYPETGHCPNWERPERMANDLDTFMESDS